MQATNIKTIILLGILTGFLPLRSMNAEEIDKSFLNQLALWNGKQELAKECMESAQRAKLPVYYKNEQLEVCFNASQNKVIFYFGSELTSFREIEFDIFLKAISPSPLAQEELALLTHESMRSLPDSKGIRYNVSVRNEDKATECIIN